MLNNLYKIKLPFISKNFTNEKSDSYKGFAYFIFQQNDKEEFNNKLIYNTAYITEINRGASNYKDLHLSSNYLTSKPLLKEYRLKSFESSEWLYKANGIKKSKKRVKFLGDINDLNLLILNVKATVKDVDAFISGSNSSGGLKNPNADPIRLNLKLNKIHPEIEEWMVFSILSNLSKSQSNTFKTFTWDELETIKTIEFTEFLKKDIKVIPYGMTGFKEDYVNFRDAFISQNVNLLYKNKSSEAFLKTNLYTLPKITMNNLLTDIDIPGEIINLIAKNKDKKQISKKLREYWGVSVRKRMELQNHNKDFVKGLSRYERAHIIEHAKMIKLLINERNEEEQRKMIDLLTKSDNYILLTNDIHNYWDKGDIIIDKNGHILNHKLSSLEFNELINKHKNINEIYENVLTKERIELLKLRELNQLY